MIDVDFLQILEEHQQRYPLMRAQDYGKLAYQNVFGPSHITLDMEHTLSFIQEEWEAVPVDSPPLPPEPIGNGLCRFHLTKGYDKAAAAPILAGLLQLTAKEHQGSVADFREKLTMLQARNIAGMSEWLSTYDWTKCPPFHHSPLFNKTYQPHYRLLKWEYAQFFPAMLRLAELIRNAGPVVAAIDGLSGSGKTRLSELIGQLFPCNIFHMDDFYLPPAQRTQDWAEIPGGNMDFHRFYETVLQPVSHGETVQYRPYDCQTDTFRVSRSLPPQQLNIVEGSYSHHPILNGQYDLRIFLTCSQETQRSRLQKREGEYFPVFEQCWIPMENRYFERFGVRNAAEIVIDTTRF